MLFSSSTETTLKRSTPVPKKSTEPVLAEGPCVCETQGNCQPCRNLTSLRLRSLGQYDPYNEER